MKIATTLFLLVVLVLGAFFFCGSLLEANRNLQRRVSELQAQVEQRDQEIQTLNEQFKQASEHNTSLQKELEDKLSQLKELKTTLASIQEELNGTRRQLKDAESRLVQTLTQLQQVTSELDQVKGKLALANATQSQALAALNQVIVERDNLAAKLKQSQEVASLASLIPGGFGLPLVIGYGVMLASVSLLGYKGYLTPHRGHPAQAPRPPVQLTMSESTYREFQQYLKKRGK
jgi:uncharacterized phage infection (PIP) family protein YhgE